MDLKSNKECVEKIIQKVGYDIVLGTPLGVGKPNHLINEFYKRARQDSNIKLTILTALTLTKPAGKSDLEKRFFEPLSERVFGDYPNLDYEIERQNGELPPNIKVIEFYYPAGKQIQNKYAQRNYLSSNFTHAARDIIDRGVNVVVQQIAKRNKDGQDEYSLSSNPDTTLDIIAKLIEREKKEGHKWASVAQINNQLPFMYGDALIDGSQFHYKVDIPEGHYKIFGPPKMPVRDEDYMIGLYASSLIKDDGELQVGIGSLGDALIYHLGIRHEENNLYREFLKKLFLESKFGPLIDKIGGREEFKKGLFGATEMVVDGFMHLYKKNILKKKVYDHLPLQRLINQGVFDRGIPKNILEIMVRKEIIENPITKNDFNFLQKYGILKPSPTITFNKGKIILNGDLSYFADINNELFYDEQHHFLGETLKGGQIVHGGFFLGPSNFYQFLTELKEEERVLFNMKSVSKINQLYGHEEIDRLHRTNARFVNTCLKVSLNGGVASDALEDGEIVSGVGGQYNFVSMAHALPDGRSILTLKSTHEGKNGIESNIVWKYGHCTIPRHLRDVVITEYGIADLRGKTDEEIIIELLNITDSRFQEELLKRCKDKGKVDQNYQIPIHFKSNIPSRLKEILSPYKERGYMPLFPFGTDFTPEELKIAKALKYLKSIKTKKSKLIPMILKALIFPPKINQSFKVLMDRMNYKGPLTFNQKLYRNLLLVSLQKTGS